MTRTGIDCGLGKTFQQAPNARGINSREPCAMTPKTLRSACGRSSSSLGGIFLAFSLGVTTMRIRYVLGIALLTGLWGCSSGGGPAEAFL
jgi:hypothetical protein